MFAYIGSTCDACHNKVTPALSFYGVTNLQTRPSDHKSGNKATQDCSACHSPSNWSNAQVRKTAAAPATTRAQIDTVVRVPAASGRQARVGAASRWSSAPETDGLPSGRAMPTHAGVTANCVSCHNGVLAQGKGAMHIASDVTCENCHVVNAWLPARFDHRGVTATCASCHNGVVAAGKPARHIQVTEDCRSCHGVLAWTPASFDHVGIAASCQSCHNGITATGKQVRHVITIADCSSCHSTLNWAAAITAPKPPLRPARSREYSHDARSARSCPRAAIYRILFRCSRKFRSCDRGARGTAVRPHRAVDRYAGA
jgi:hypothetical protein